MRTTGYAAFALLVLTACSAQYDVAIENIGRRPIETSYVYYGRFQSVGGVLPAGVLKVHGGVTHRLTETAAVHWSRPNGRAFVAHVPLKRVVASAFRGGATEIRFKIADDDQVRLAVVIRGPNYNNTVHVIPGAWRGIPPT